MKRLLLAVVAASALHSQAAGPRDLELVGAVDVVVVEENGVFSHGVTKDDLIVDGVERSIESVERVDGPGSVVLLQDMTLSLTIGTEFQYPGSWDMWGNGLANLITGLERDLPQRLPKGDNVRVGRFGGSMLAVSEPFANNSAGLRAAVRGMLDVAAVEPNDRMGASPTWDVIAKVARLMHDAPAPRAIVLLTDGESSGNVRSVEDAAREAVALGVSVSVIIESPADEIDRPSLTRVRYPPEYPRDRLVGQMATWTGGLMIKDDRQTRTTWGWNTPGPPLAPIFGALHGRHRMTFALQGLKEGATVEVRARNPRHRVYAPRWLSKP